jgi:hypothetical protein
VWEVAMGLRLDGRGAELAEATDLLEEAGELLQRARHKAGARRGAEAEAAEATPPAKKPPAKKAPVKKAPVKAKAPAKKAPPPPPAKGGAKKTTAARGRSGRKK